MAIAYLAVTLANFNSRPSARGDTKKSCKNVIANISIHAPPRGATTRYWRISSRTNFNSRPSARGDPKCMMYRYANGDAFQFTPLREGRRVGYDVHYTSVNFNSRPSARGDGGHQHAGRHHQAISIHAPPRGATIIEQKYTFILIFQFTPLREGRLISVTMSEISIYFNSRPSARGDPCGSVAHAPCSSISIHAPPRGATLEPLTRKAIL